MKISPQSQVNFDDIVNREKKIYLNIIQFHDFLAVRKKYFSLRKNNKNRLKVVKIFFRFNGIFLLFFYIEFFFTS